MVTTYYYYYYEIEREKGCDQRQVRSLMRKLKTTEAGGRYLGWGGPIAPSVNTDQKRWHRESEKASSTERVPLVPRFTETLALEALTLERRGPMRRIVAVIHSSLMNSKRLVHWLQVSWGVSNRYEEAWGQRHYLWLGWGLYLLPSWIRSWDRGDQPRASQWVLPNQQR